MAHVREGLAESRSVGMHKGLAQQFRDPSQVRIDVKDLDPQLTFKLHVRMHSARVGCN